MSATTFNKLIIGGVAPQDGVLPFQNEAFNAYISNLEINKVDYQDQMLIDAYRVLTPGSLACFTMFAPNQTQSFEQFIKD